MGIAPKRQHIRTARTRMHRCGSASRCPRYRSKPAPFVVSLISRAPMAKAWLKLQAANDRAAPNSRQAGKKDKAEQRRKESQRNRDYQTGAYTSEMDNTIDVGDRQGSYLNCGYPFGPTNIPE